MSLTAMVWALKTAQVSDPHAKLVLIALADHAGDDGTNAWPSQKTMAEYAGASDRTVRRKLEELEEDGWIRRGDQTIVAHLRGDRRPVVWDLGYAPQRPAADDIDDTEEAGEDPSDEGHDRTESPAGTTGQRVRPDKNDRHGRTLLSDKPSLEPTNSSREVTTSRHDQSRPSLQEHQGKRLAHPERCRRHQDTEAPGPCGPCGAARRTHQDQVQADELAIRRRHAKEQREAREERLRLERLDIDNCHDCDDVGRLPSGRRCRHDGGAAEAASRRGLAAARQALNAAQEARTSC